MGFFIAMFICNCLVPLVVVISGYLMYKHPPKKVNGIIGYRTKMSMINEDTWHFAHDVCGRMWLKIGSVMLIAAVIVQLPFLHADESTVSNLSMIVTLSEVVILIISIIPVERKLKATFDEEGNRK